MFKTDLTNEEVSEAANKLIKNNTCNFYELKLENILDNIDLTNNCIYCNDVIKDKIIIDTNNIKVGYFCTITCKHIYYSIIRTIFNLPIHKIINFIPFFLLSEESKIKYKNIKNIINYYNYDDISIFSKYKDNNNIYTEFKLLINNKFIYLQESFEYISKSNNCIYCYSTNINDKIILEHNNGIIKGFCSIVCRDSISKQIYNTIMPIYKFSAYLVPFELIKNKKEFLNNINHIKNIDNLYGGYCHLTNNKTKVELFITN
ncbi:putative late transcription factor [Betaentomopoxvirus amoorei]|uniref:AMV047 n=1 Tax=Amsacta moorei entomopoxvirus TaxID=28321 RepID=Q9EN01_AMEPV|nr:putative late transcription factor [Amsacta moorei entomopoxvirus]AAG02753.1 AMV047 [Amsacta moorei entomopoxvirus]